MSLRNALLLIAAAAASGCNPNWEPGEKARENPPPWQVPGTAGSGRNPHGDDRGNLASMEGVIAALEKKIAENPQDVDALRQLGQALSEVGEWDRSAQLLQEAIALAPKDVDLRVLRARVLMQRKDQGAALAELEGAKKISPDHEGLLRAFGSYYVGAKDMKKAAEMRRTLLAKHPDIEDADLIEREAYYLTKFSALENEGKLKTFFDTAGAAKLRMRQERFDEAIPLLQKVLEILPDDAEHWTQLGIAQRGTGRKAEGVASFRKALSFDKNYPNGRVELARALAEDGDRKAAANVLQEWKKIDAKRAERFDASGLIARIESGAPLKEGGSVGIPTPGAAGGGAILGSVKIAPEVAAKVPQNARLMVIAKTSPEERMPLAVVNREGVTTFPHAFTLGPENVMMQGTPFRGSVWLTARIEVDGQMGAGPGDLEGIAAKAVEVGSAGVEIVIDRVVGAPGAPRATPLAFDPPKPSGGSGAKISGKITLAPSLASKVPPGATLYVFAKPNPGPGAPLAVVRSPAPSSWKDPVPFELTENDTMMQGMPFEGALYLTARIDQDGSAGATPGDLEGVTKTPVNVGTTGVSLTIDTVR